MNMIEQVETKLKQSLQQALEEVMEQEKIDFTKEELPEIEVEVPREDEHGDYASNLALVMASKFQTSPREVAQKVVEEIESSLIDEISIAGPGFINFRLNKDWLYEIPELILEAGDSYGEIDFGENRSVLLEFVSANPTGPLHVGHSRGAVTGDVLAAVMEKAGYEVQTEYYINDAGNQMDILGQSTYLRYQQELGREVELPEDCYAGDYLCDIAQDLKSEYGTELVDKDNEKALQICREFAYEKMIDQIKEDLFQLGIEFDSWFSERELHQGKIEQVLDVLKDNGYIYEKEGATWFAAAQFSDEKDRVVVKSDGSFTYLAADIAYHYDKLEREFDQLINIWGADHHGYIPRMKAMMEALGEDPGRLEILIVQLVNLLREGEKVQMSKRSGDFVTMRDVIKEVGCDAARYFYIMRSAESHLDFDLELAKEESTNNPVYYVQYAHARIHSILENFDQAPEFDSSEIELELLESEEEIDLLKELARYPEVIRISADSRQPHHIASYAHDLAGAFHVFYNKRRVMTDDKELSKARIYLVSAVRQVLKNVLSLLGLTAPKQM